MFTKGSEFNLANWPSGNLAKWISVFFLYKFSFYTNLNDNSSPSNC